MKKIFGIALVLALAMVASLCAPVLAWDMDDPCVAANEDFVAGVGTDGWVSEWHVGGQLFGGDGYNLYRDDVTNTGTLDGVLVITYTPGEIDLPYKTPRFWFFPGSAFGASPDTWYWATEPRGDNLPECGPQYLTIILPDDSLRIERYGTMRYTDVDFNDGTWRIEIWSGVRIWSDEGGAAVKLFVDENGNIMPGVWWHRGEIIVTRM